MKLPQPADLRGEAREQAASREDLEWKNAKTEDVSAKQAGDLSVVFASSVWRKEVGLAKMVLLRTNVTVGPQNFEAVVSSVFAPIRGNSASD